MNFVVIRKIISLNESSCLFWDEDFVKMLGRDIYLLNYFNFIMAELPVLCRTQNQ